MTQNGVEFFVDGLVTGDSGRFTVIGRCGDEPIRLDDRFTAVIRYKPRRYPDEIGEAPIRTAEEAASLRVICIHAYDRSLSMLGQGMTGSLVVEGDGLQHVTPGWALGTANRDTAGLELDRKVIETTSSPLRQLRGIDPS